MPRIRWSGLPPALRYHLFDRLRERKITGEDLYQLKAWRESNPDAPDGLWYKDFGSFTQWLDRFPLPRARISHTREALAG